ncbi:DoxX family protein [Nocardia sp. NBC_01327]|uniref:DoxX family protein n=1 Tax=Nocardia sp. NBC_01327 TaxID=2903593 RepID=UPI002E156CD0|nr:DoxX family protein [Nocardia sp. NBC_01327]
MTQLAAAEVIGGDEERAAGERWHPLARMGFRFGFVFLGIGMAGAWLTYALLRSFGVPQRTVTAVAEWTALHPLTDVVGEHLFGVRIDFTPTGSGDTAAQWVSIFTWLLVAVVVTAVWSVLDRRRPDYSRLYEWFRLLLRAALVSALLLYGMVKLLPSQMSFSLDRLVEPFGDMSPMAVLWAQTSLSQPYEIALGAAELTAALLLVLPRTAGLGSVLAVIVTLQIFLLNLTFDVPVKIFSLQLFLYALVLAAPHIVRTVTALAGGAVPVRSPEPLRTTPRGNRILLIAQLVFGVWLLFTAITEGADAWHSYGNDRPHSPLYGIWDITDYTVGGQDMPALVDFSRSPDDNQMLSATVRLRRIIFDIPIGMTAQRMDDSLFSLPAQIDTDRHTVILSKDLAHQLRIATLEYRQPQPDQLILEGQLGGRPVRMQLTRIDLQRFPAVARGFHWMQPVPYFR